MDSKKRSDDDGPTDELLLGGSKPTRRFGRLDPTELLPGRILVVEDDALQGRMMVEAIRRLGEDWKIVHVCTAKDCLTVLESTTFAAVVIDLVLPDASGMDILREIRSRGWGVATVLVTAHGSEQIAVEALRLGVSDYVKKEEGYLDHLTQAVARTVTEYRQRLRKQSSYSRLRVELARRTHGSLLDSFAAPIVHDIKSPLTYITAAGEFLDSGIGRNMEPKQLSRLVLKGARAIRQLVDRLLKFARQEGEERVSLDLATFLAGLVDTESENLELQNVRLTKELCAGPVLVTAGPSSMEQVFLNLIANASECLGICSGGGQIVVALTQEESHAVARVRDSGPGIPPDVLPRLFVPFSTFGKGGRGTGLGLSIIAGIVWEHGGRIAAENLPDGGACFTVRLPLKGHGPVALVLEDESYVQDLMRTHLDALGVRMDLHADGTEVLAKLDGGKWDIVILDLRTPGASGVEVLEAMVKRRPDLMNRTMVVSGGLEDRTLQELVLTHPVPCLPKPYTVEEFNDVVLFLLRASSSR
ncbi:MAG: response regulator [Candidatus Riflebacteria bacterium]|nr:response regulator [Candidatus Riflebacteria bacterium]